MITAVCFMLTAAAPVARRPEPPPEAAEQVLLRLLFQPARDAIAEYYGESRQYWEDRIVSIQKVPDTPYYEVVMQAETFCGPHNPPYGLETITLYVSYGSLELKSFAHRDEPE
ncbi:hypothetical protein SDC9_135739 [bioreactor metagenome]|uniref:DUF3888 domain-containing protein n=1 Tax=bioreactor metagenome TaxID=1076179 RepID=A0A645DHE5_9ZZZZ